MGKCISLPRKRKSGPLVALKTCLVLDFVEDIRAGIKLRKLTGESAIDYVLAHLEGSARQEVQHRQDREKKDAESIMNILLEAFGDKLNASQLMRQIYNRVQNEDESVTQYAYALLALATRLQRKPEAPESKSVIKEQFKDGLSDPVLRREVKRLYKEKPELSFLEVRDWAVEMDEEELKGINPRKKKCTTYQAEATAQMGKMVEGLTAAIKGQTEVLDKMIAQQGIFNSRLSQLEERQDNARSARRPPLDKSKIECHRCHRMGHYARECESPHPGGNPRTQRAGQSNSQQQQQGN